MGKQQQEHHSCTETKGSCDIVLKILNTNVKHIDGDDDNDDKKLLMDEQLLNGVNEQRDGQKLNT